jgi:WD40 repeat protein
MCRCGHGTVIAAAGPDGVCARDRTARLRSRSGSELATYAGHAASVTSVAFSPNGRLALTTGDDDTAAG